MPQTAAEILEAARKLPRHQQLWISNELSEEEEASSPEEIEAAWSDEIKHRLDEIDSGQVELVPGEEVMERLHARIEALKLRR